MNGCTNQTIKKNIQCRKHSFVNVTSFQAKSQILLLNWHFLETFVILNRLYKRWLMTVLSFTQISAWKHPNLAVVFGASSLKQWGEQSHAVALLYVFSSLLKQLCGRCGSFVKQQSHHHHHHHPHTAHSLLICRTSSCHADSIVFTELARSGSQMLFEMFFFYFVV